MPVNSRLRHKLLIAILLCLCSGLYTQAQEWTFEHLGTDLGLPSSETYHIFQDERAYIYVVTEYGLVKYNGSRFVAVCTNIPVSERVPYAFCKSKSGLQLFINSQLRIYYLRNDSAFRLQMNGHTVPAVPISNPANQLIEDGEGNIYACTPYISYRYDAASTKWIFLNNARQLSGTIFLEKKKDGYWGDFVNALMTRITIINSEYAGTYEIDSADFLLSRHKIIENEFGLYTFSRKQIIHIDKQRKLHTYCPGYEVISMSGSADGRRSVICA